MNGKKELELMLTEVSIMAKNIVINDDSDDNNDDDNDC